MLFETIIGPIHSRRLGSSLGVNLLPLQRKVCTYDCIYCECGWNKETERETIEMPTLADVRPQLEKRLQELVAQNVPVDSFTFAGNGEPTLHPEFPQVVDFVIRMRDKYYPKAVTTLLTNATQIHRPEIFYALQKIDNPVLKLDAGTASMQAAINRPTNACPDFLNISENIARLGNRCIIQTLLLRGEHNGQTISNVSDSEFAQYVNKLKKIHPKYVMLYAIDRATPEKKLEKLTVEEMEKFAQVIRNEGVDVKVYG